MERRSLSSTPRPSSSPVSRSRSSPTSKRKGPFYPRRADLLFKRCVRGMIPWTSTSGREAYRRLHVFVGTPKQFQDCEKERPEEACRKITGKYTTLGAVSKFLGSNVR